MSQLDIDSTKITTFCRQNDIEFLGIFGSAARGETRAGSDVDLLVRLSQPKSLLELVRLERQLENVFARKIDLITEPALSPYIKDRVMAELKPLYGTPQ